MLAIKLYNKKKLECKKVKKKNDKKLNVKKIKYKKDKKVKKCSYIEAWIPLWISYVSR